MTNVPSDLLPVGFRDRLPPHASRQAALRRAMLDVLAGYGYARVAPPLVEFESTLTNQMSDGGRGGLLRVTDPASGRMLALRSDITMQVGRLASSRLAGEPRPLRLSYQGPVLRLNASQLRPERELSQLGAELIGSDSVAAVAEIVLVAVEALEAAGVKDITVDFTLPDLVETLAKDALPLDGAQLDAVRAKLDMKDAGALKDLGADDYLPLLGAMGPFAEALEKLREIDAGGALASRLAALEEIAERIKGKANITLDPTERHGFEYQSWFGFTLFAAGHSVALGRGGTYTISDARGKSEVAAGFSLYPDPLTDMADGGSAGENEKRLFLPLGTMSNKAAILRTEGWITVAALDEHDDAAKLGCTHILSSGKAVTL
ncbi:MAG: ATP phosphoribosyltransferase regulatory subunit [Sphingorhabdus sp.]